MNSGFWFHNKFQNLLPASVFSNTKSIIARMWHAFLLSQVPNGARQATSRHRFRPAIHSLQNLNLQIYAAVIVRTTCEFIPKACTVTAARDRIARRTVCETTNCFHEAAPLRGKPGRKPASDLCRSSCLSTAIRAFPVADRASKLSIHGRRGRSMAATATNLRLASTRRSSTRAGDGEQRDGEQRDRERRF